MTFFSCSLLNVNPLKCVNQECNIRSEIINVNSNEHSFHPYSIKINIRSGSCNSINHPNAKLCASDVTEDINVKIFNLISRTSETRHIEWYETCKCKCRLDGSVCNNKKRWIKNKCRCECKELIDKGICNKRYI